MSPIHDYTISNASGSSVRNDLQSALRALNSANSNSSAPTDQLTAFTPWGDTGNNIFKRRNQANNDWISLRKADGTVLIPDGSAASPSIQPSDDGNTGIYSPSSDQIGISCGGTLRLTISGSAITTTEPIGLPDANASLPALVFSDDTDTGLYSSTANQLDIATGGTRRLSVSSSSLSVVPDLILENQADIRFSEDSGNGSNYIAFQAPASISSNVTFTLPATDGSNGETLLTNGSGTLSWGSPSLSNLNASNLTSGTIPNARFPATLPAISGANLTNVSGASVKAFVNFQGTGTVAVRAAQNVSSITDNGTGDYTVNFSSSLADANYTPTCMTLAHDTLGAQIQTCVRGSSTSGPTTMSTSACRIMRGSSSTNNYTDGQSIYFAALR